MNAPVAVVVDRRQIAMHPHIGHLVQVGLQIALRVAPEAMGHPRPGVVHREFADPSVGRPSASSTSISRPSRGPAKLAGETGRDRVVREQAAAGLGAAGVVEDRQAPCADRLEQPAPGRLVPGFAGRGESAKADEILPRRRRRPPWRANRARRSARCPGTSARLRSTMCQSRLASGKFGRPSTKTMPAPNCRQPTIISGPSIQPMSAIQPIRSAACTSKA